MLGEIGTVLGIASTVVALSSALYTWLTSRSKANADTIEALKDEHTTLRERVQKLESEIIHLPDKDSVHRLELHVTEMSGSIGRIEEQFKGVSRTVNRIDDFLMKAGGRT